MTNNYDPETIEAYLLGKLDTKKSQEFEKALLQDPGLQQEVNFMKDIFGGIQTAGDEDLSFLIEKAEMELDEKGYFKEYGEDLDDDILGGITKYGEMEAERQEAEIKSIAPKESVDLDTPQEVKTTKIKQFPTRRLLALAASVLFLISVGTYFFSNSQNQYERVFADHFSVNHQLLDDQITNLSELGIATPNKTQKNRLKETLIAFKACEKSDCKLSEINQFTKDYPDDQSAHFFLATTLMERGDYQTAANFLEPLVDNPTFNLQTAAQWYLALSYLKMENKQSEAIALFQKIAAHSNTNYTAPAKEILIKLGS